jgi:thioredoxin-like negative regulator of GroEL
MIKKHIQYDVKSYPSIILVKDGQTIDFDSKVTYENLEIFINSIYI